MSSPSSASKTNCSGSSQLSTSTASTPSSTVSSTCTGSPFKKNAFNVLMQSSARSPSRKKKRSSSSTGSGSARKSSSSSVSPSKKKKPRTTTSSRSSGRSSTSSGNGGGGIGFVECPLGCGRHVANLEHSINRHLDFQCTVMKQQRLQAKQQPEPPLSSQTEPENGEPEPEFQEPSQQEIEEPDPIVMKQEEESMHTCIDSPIKAEQDEDSDKAEESCTPNLSSSTEAHQNTDSAMTSKTTIEDHNNLDVGHALLMLHASSIVSPENSQPQPTPLPPIDQQTVTQEHQTQQQESTPSPNSATDDKKQTNVFAHMMQQSSKVFASANSTKQVQQHLTLHYDPNNKDSLEFSWNLQVIDNDNNHPQQEPPPLWSCDSKLKDKETDPHTTIALTVSVTSNDTLANSTQDDHRWVRKHSRLSVPVLKSILQKSVRRRRPLPSVRVAMELMDKALGEFLRRLPIIVLEDSTLHPDYPLLIWAMVAHSKGFFDIDTTDAPDNEDNATKSRWNVIRALQLRLLRIVYQVASCPVQDHLSSQKQDPNDEASPTSAGQGQTPINNATKPCLSNPFLVCEVATTGKSTESDSTMTRKRDGTDPVVTKQQPQDQQSSQKQLQLSIWAMLVRAKYGGMSCDVRMLYLYAQTWHDRLQQEGDDATWLDVPKRMHEKAVAASTTRLASTDIFLERLCLPDICRQGVDFHCSNIIPTLLQDSQLRTAVQQMADGMECSAETLLQRIIWKFSAGVNLRRPLATESKKGGRSNQHQDQVLNQFWKDVLDDLVTAFQTKYLGERLR
ncbi:expressed unknown protein [Seminavis robusta]|uniref:Uncharacterized protein n=1 Tax=Seminavis robusta TaxID=568900 RepID=A0A9N8EF99_9STRA|nr:expressed unknown protein [Seminavis robusta]|eukprot:Sro1098_g241030.1 n/a (788) ;mRNA; f:33665-36028